MSAAITGRIPDGTTVFPVAGDWLTGQPHVVNGYDPDTGLYDVRYAPAIRTAAQRNSMPLYRELYAHEFTIADPLPPNDSFTVNGARL